VNLSEIARALELEYLTPALVLDDNRGAGQGYVSDLLSDVLGHAPAGSLLITLQVHMNVVAVAAHAELAGVIFAAGRRPEQPVMDRAVEEGLPLWSSQQSAFDLVGRLYDLGLKGG